MAAHSLRHGEHEVNAFIFSLEAPRMAIDLLSFEPTLYSTLDQATIHMRPYSSVPTSKVTWSLRLSNEAIG